MVFNLAAMDEIASAGRDQDGAAVTTAVLDRIKHIAADRCAMSCLCSTHTILNKLFAVPLSVRLLCFIIN